MTDALTRAAATRWHHGAPIAAVALRAAAARRLPGSAAAEAVYLRAGIGPTRPADTQFTDADCASLVPAALYGCGLGGDGAPHRSVGDFGTVAGLELGLGYAVSCAVRLEALVGYRPRELPGPRPPAIRVRGSVLAVWDPGPRVSFEKRRDRPGRRVCGDGTETMRRGGEGALSVISRISSTTDRNSRRRSYACGLRPSTSRRCSSNRAARGRTAPSNPSPARGGMNCWTARSSTHARKPRS